MTLCRRLVLPGIQQYMSPLRLHARVRGQILEISSDGKIIWNLKEKKYCDPDGAIPYTRWGDKPLLGVGTGALIGKIGDNSSDSFLIGKEQELHVYQSGRLYLGINDDNTADNEGLYRARIRMIK